MNSDTHHKVTALLQRAKDGKAQAAWEEIRNLLEEDLRRIARKLLKGERAGRTLQTTALVDDALLELYERLGAGGQLPDNRQKLKSFLAAVMRNELVSYARKRRARKKAEKEKLERERAQAGPVRRVVAEPTDDGDARLVLTIDDGEFTARVLDVNEAIDWMEQRHPGSRDVLNRRFWLRQTIPEIAADLGLTVDAAENIVRTALRRLAKHLRPEGREHGS